MVMIKVSPVFRIGDIDITLSMDTDTETVTETYEVMGVLVTVTSMFPEAKDQAFWLTDRLSLAREAAGQVLMAAIEEMDK